MSILINMEMPKNCMDCPMNYDSIDCVLADISLRDKDHEFLYEDKRSPNCPLIGLPPHGRLIEDTALDNMSMWNTDREYDRGWDSAVQAAKNRIKTAPTIIDAENADCGRCKVKGKKCKQMRESGDSSWCDVLRAECENADI